MAAGRGNILIYVASDAVFVRIFRADDEMPG